VIESMELASVWLGLRLGLYEALRTGGPATVAELAGRAGVDAEDRRYRLPAAHAEALLADDGVLVVADEKVAETFTAPGDEIERLNFAFSWWHCPPASRAETPSAAAGTALRPGTVRDRADRAGFASLRELPVDHLFWRFYELR
jgi:hypothetical protein